MQEFLSISPLKFPYLLIDLAHTLDENTPSWDGESAFTASVVLDYAHCPGPSKFRVQKIDMMAGIGTHIDSPAHCIPGGLTVDQMPLSQLISPCVVIDVSRQAHESYKISCQDIEAFEAIHGTIPKDTFVMMKTGWARFWMNPEQYRNNHLFPSVSEEAAALLLSRNISGLGIDTLSPDRPEDDYPVHQILLSAGKYLVENVANLEHLPSVGSLVMVIPMKIKNGTEAPVRLIGLISKDDD